MLHFTYFPKVEYSNNQAVNIMVRAKIRDAILEKRALYYTYEITDSDRPDIIASKYYGNPNSTWAIFYANEIMDPRFEWPLNHRQFQRYIVSKYGSIAKAKNIAEEPHHYLLDEEYIIDRTTYYSGEYDADRLRAVSNYDYEEDINRQRRQIKILDAYYLRQIENEMETLFQDA